MSVEYRNARWAYATQPVGDRPVIQEFVHEHPGRSTVSMDTRDGQSDISIWRFGIPLGPEEELEFALEVYQRVREKHHRLYA